MLRTFVGVLLVLAASVGCGGESFYHYHRTVVGLDIAGNVAGNSPHGHLILGYSRKLVTSLPKDAQRAMSGQGQASDTELPSTVFCTQVRASLGGVNAFREVLATGDPAERYADALVEAAAGITDYEYRNFVCPGYTIPVPLPTTTATPTPQTAQDAKRGAVKAGDNNPQGVVAPVSPLPAPGGAK